MIERTNLSKTSQKRDVGSMRLSLHAGNLGPGRGWDGVFWKSKCRTETVFVICQVKNVACHVANKVARHVVNVFGTEEGKPHRKPNVTSSTIAIGTKRDDGNHA
eukprot:1395402-Amphidinium_carterae.1